MHLEGKSASGFCQSTNGPDAVDESCTTRRGNAHSTEIGEEREVLYPWHPWAGCTVLVHEAVEKLDGTVLRCSREGGSRERWLVDSRTGLTDIGGVCTVQIPDVVVFVFAYNSQNIDGIETIAAALSDRRNPTLTALQRWPTLHFLPSRKELSEPRRLRNWEATAEQKLSRFCSSPQIIAEFGRVINYLRKLSVPYVPYFAYGEDIAVRDELGLEIRQALEPLIELLLGGDGENSLDTLTVRPSEFGHQEEALAAAEKAVAIGRDLTRSWPELAPELAFALNNLANRLSEMGRREEELAAAR